MTVASAYFGMKIVLKFLIIAPHEEKYWKSEFVIVIKELTALV